MEYWKILDIISVVISIFGLVGNTLSFRGFQKLQKKTCTSFLLQALAICDNLVLITTGLYLCRVYFMRSFVFNTLNNIIFYIPLVMCETALLCSIGVTVLLAITRLIAVCFPLRVKSLCTIKRAKWYVGATIAFSVIYHIPKCVCYFTRMYRCYESFEDYGGLTVFCVIPSLIIIISTIIIAVKLKQLDHRRAEMTQRRQSRRTSILIPLAVLVVYIISSLPVPVYIVTSRLGITHDFFLYFQLSQNFFNVINSSVNFIIYTVLSRPYRKAMLQNNCKCVCPWRRSGNNEIELR